MFLDTQKVPKSLIYFRQESPEHIQNWKSYCKRPFQTIQILSIFRQLCLAVAYIHDQGLIHRDIHPTRINEIDNTVKLNLIGMPYNFKKLIKTDTFCGHINYSAPETLSDNASDFTEKVDIWALGCCLYFLSAKKDPFEAHNAELIKMNIRNLQIDETMRGFPQING